MKKTDYMPRSSMFDYFVASTNSKGGLIGLELGVDAGAHAESMFRSWRYRWLDLVDPWPNDFYRGICKGRLDALGGFGRYELWRTTAQRYLSVNEGQARHDAIYCDLPQDGETAKAVVPAAWARLSQGGIFGYRNYCDSWPDMKAVLDAHVAATGAIVLSTEANELVLQKGKS